MSTVESYRNETEVTQGLECVCCQTQMDAHDSHCSECQTPAEITRSLLCRQTRPHFISVVGASNAGKTVYMGLLLDILCGDAKHLKGIPNGAFSIGLQEHVVTALEQRTFPEKTPTESDLWKWLHCVVTDTSNRKPKEIDFVAPDFAGEAIAAELEQPGLYPAVHHVISRSSALLLLCDSTAVRDQGSREDLFAMKLGSYISQVQGLADLDTKKDLSPAVAIVFTKSDECSEAVEDPQRFMSNNMPRFLDYCNRSFPRHSIFAASVVGASGMLSDSNGNVQRVPLHVEPRGVIEPLHWAIQNS